MATREVFIVGAARTPIGAFQGALEDVPAPKLGALSITAALERAKVGAADVGEAWMGNVLTAGVGQAPARQAARFAGLPDGVPATTVGKVCGSGLQAVILAAKSILLGDTSIAVAGGMESMSRAPYLLPGARGGLPDGARAGARLDGPRRAVGSLQRLPHGHRRRALRARARRSPVTRRTRSRRSRTAARSRRRRRARSPPRSCP